MWGLFSRAVFQSEELLLLSPEAKLRVLDNVFLHFDDLVALHPGALKIETVGGVYLVAANGARRVFEPDGVGSKREAVGRMIF